MSNTATLPLDPLQLAAERGRLVRYCSRQVSSTEVAEDLAQETLLIAWERRHTLRDGALWQAWLTGIARNVCLRYLRRLGIERQRVVTADGEQSGVTFDSLADTSLPDLNEILFQDDLNRLLDRALSDLPRSSHDLLIDRYINNLPIEEIAARRGLREETATVQLHRSRQALKRVLMAPELRDESVALGLVEEQNAIWQETRLWCPNCGKYRLSGILGCPQNSEWRSFILRCPGCNGPDDSLVNMGNVTMLEGIKGFKPALNRINRWWWDFSQDLLHNPTPKCIKCGHRPLHVMIVAPPDFRFPYFRGMKGLFAVCPKCSFASAIEIHEIARQSPAGQKFWQENPRFRTLPMQAVSSTNGPLLVTRMESVTDSNAIEIAISEQTLEIAHVIHV